MRLDLRQHREILNENQGLNPAHKKLGVAGSPQSPFSQGCDPLASPDCPDVHLPAWLWLDHALLEPVPLPR